MYNPLFLLKIARSENATYLKSQLLSVFTTRPFDNAKSIRSRVRITSDAEKIGSFHIDTVYVAM